MPETHTPPTLSDAETAFARAMADLYERLKPLKKLLNRTPKRDRGEVQDQIDQIKREAESEYRPHLHWMWCQQQVSFFEEQERNIVRRGGSILYGPPVRPHTAEESLAHSRALACATRDTADA